VKTKLGVRFLVAVGVAPLAQVAAHHSPRRYRARPQHGVTVTGVVTEFIGNPHMRIYFGSRKNGCSRRAARARG
jgi:hypothetical protein